MKKYKIYFTFLSLRIFFCVYSTFFHIFSSKTEWILFFNINISRWLFKELSTLDTSQRIIYPWYFNSITFYQTKTSPLISWIYIVIEINMIRSRILWIGRFIVHEIKTANDTINIKQYKKQSISDFLVRSFRIRPCSKVQMALNCTQPQTTRSFQQIH